MIKKGTTSIDGIFKGSTEIAEIRKGTDLVYENFKTLTSEGVPPLTLSNCKNTNMLGYKIYGQSTQSSSPTPSSPVDILSVGNQTINLYGGKNTYTVSGVTNETPSQWYVMKANKTYTIAMYIDNSNATSTSAFRMSVGYSSSSWNYNKSNDISSGSKGWARATFTVPSNYNSNLNMQYQPGTGGATYSQIMLLEGSYTVAQLPSYEIFGYKIPVNIKGINKLSNNIFTSLPRTPFEQSTNRTLYAEYHLSNANLKANTTYTIMAKYTNLNGGVVGLSLLKGGDNYPNTYSFTKQGYACLRFNTLNNLDTLIQFATRNFGSSGSSVKYENFMLLEGDYSSETIPKYEPYIAPTTIDIYLDAPLRKFGDYVDYIDFENQKVIRNVQAGILNGKEDWNSAGTRFYYSANNLNTKALGTGVVGIMSDDLPGTTWNTIRNSGTGIATYSDNRIDIRYTDWSSIDDAKTYLKANLLNYIAPALNPTEESITLPNILLNKGTNIVSIDTTTTPSNMWIKYKGK